MTRLIVPFYDTGLTTLGTGTITSPELPAKVLGHIVGFKITISASASGTLTNPNVIELAIQSIKITDASHSVIHQIDGGSLISLSYFLSPTGKYTSPTTVSSSLQSDVYMLFSDVALKDQPVRASVVFNPYSALASSGATGGQAEVAIDLIVENDPRMYPVGEPSTVRSKVFVASIVNGKNSLAPLLAQGIKTVGLFLGGTNNANFSEFAITNITFRSTGTVEQENVPISTYAALDNYLNLSGHIVSQINLRISPCVITSATTFDILTTSSGNMPIFQVYVT